MAVQTWQSGDCVVTLDEESGELRVSGNGAMEDYAWSGSPWKGLETLKSLVLEEGVTSIGEHAFFGCSGFTGSLTIPGSVTSIGDAAFQDCSGFTGSLTIPESVTSIGGNAFYCCSGFTGSLTIPKGVTSIEREAFFECSGFTGNLIIPEGVTSIEPYTFYYCSGFTGSLTIPESVTSIWYSAFSGCSGFTGSLTIPEGVTSISDDAFACCSGFISSLTIPESVTRIENGAFYGCSGLEQVINKAKTQTIASDAFNRLSNNVAFWGYPENTTFREIAGERWQEIIPACIATLQGTNGGELYPRTKAEGVYLSDGRTVEAALGGKAEKSAAVDITLPAEDWAGEAPPYTQRVAVAGVTAESNLVVGPPPEAGREELEAWQLGGIRAAAQGQGTLTFTAQGEKPAVACTASILIVG